MIKATGVVGRALYRGDAALHFIYVKKSSVANRLVWPLKWEGKKSFLAFDFLRNDLRTFDCDQITRIRYIPANQLFLPVEMLEIKVKCQNKCA